MISRLKAAFLAVVFTLSNACIVFLVLRGNELSDFLVCRFLWVSAILANVLALPYVAVAAMGEKKR